MTINNQSETTLNNYLTKTNIQFGITFSTSYDKERKKLSKVIFSFCYNLVKLNKSVITTALQKHKPFLEVG